MGSHFVIGNRLNFSLAEQETKTSILQAIGLRLSSVMDLRNKPKRSQICQFLIKMFSFSYRDMLRMVSDQHIHHKK